MKVQFTPVGNLNLTMAQGFFHLMNETGAHNQAQTHPNDWYGSGVTSDSFLSGGVMEELYRAHLLISIDLVSGKSLTMGIILSIREEFPLWASFVEKHTNYGLVKPGSLQ